MVYISPVGRNWGPTVNWDALGKLYASIAISWTIILYSGIAWLVTHRHLPYLRMRNIPLAITATSFLHVYVVKILLAYTTNGHFLCSVEFWIMSIYLPFGIALFQANMTQLLSISTQQRQLLAGERVFMRQPRPIQLSISSLWSRWRALGTIKRTYVAIGIGMLLQVVITAAIYGTSKKLQGHWGKLPKPQGQALCRKGLEWIPSSLWQLFWSCLYGPYLLYKIRNVRDTHHWRLQTILCVISGFPGSPMWLTAVFSPKFKWVNRYWVPPMWIAPGIIVMQAVTVFFPIYENYTSKRLSRNTMAMLRSCENSEAWDDTTLGSRSSMTKTKSMSNQEFSTTDTKSMKRSDYRSNEMYGMSALEKAIAVNPTPLLHFAATKDFTAENIIFLIAVRNWRASWAVAPVTSQRRTVLFKQALEIYAQSVSEKLALFPINIEGSIRLRLDAVFEPAIKKLKIECSSRPEAVVDPFNEVTVLTTGCPVELSHIPLELSPSHESQLEIRNPSPPSTVWPLAGHETRDGANDIGRGQVLNGDASEWDATIPADGFDATVFDAAERSIKYLVVTNTWRKMVIASMEADPRVSVETLT